MVVSVIVAIYNGQNYLEEQLVSIYSQLPSTSEVVLCDDGSTDDSVAIAAGVASRYSGVKTQVILNSRVGIIRNFESGIRAASGETLLLSDQDDVWMPSKVSRYLVALENCDLVLSDCEVVDRDMRVVAPSFFFLNGSRPGIIPNFVKNSFLGCCLGFRRSLVKHILPIPAGVGMHDIWIGMMGEVFGRVVFLSEKLVRYRRHGSNASFSGEKSRFSLRKQIFLRWTLAVNVISRYFRWRLQREKVSPRF